MVAVAAVSADDGGRSRGAPRCCWAGADEGRSSASTKVVTTLLFNLVLLFVDAMLDGPMKDPTAMGWPQSVALRASWSSASSSMERGAHRLLRGRWPLPVGAVPVHDARFPHPRGRRQCPRRRVRGHARGRARKCWSPAVGRARRAGLARSRSPDAPATSRSTCRRATATAAS